MLMSVSLTLFSLSVFVKFGSSNCWTDPVGSPSLTITPEPGDVIAARAGDEVEYTCSFMEHPGYTYRVYWLQSRGNILYEISSMIDGELTLRMRLTEADDGTAIFCRVCKRTSWNPYWSYFPPLVNSKAIKLTVSLSGDGPRHETIHRAPPTLTISAASGYVKSEYNEGEEIELTCRAHSADMISSLLVWQQVKGNLEMPRTYGVLSMPSWETASTLKTNLTIADDNTKLYCWIEAFYDLKFVSVRSDYIYVRVRSEATHTNYEVTTEEQDDKQSAVTVYTE